MKTKTNISITLSKTAMKAVEDYMRDTGVSRSKTIEELILAGKTNRENARIVEDTVNRCLADLRKKISSDFEEASAPMLKATKSLNSMRKAHSQTRQASLATFVLLSILAPTLFDTSIKVDGRTSNAYNFTEDLVSDAEFFDWFWSLGGMLADGRRGHINSQTAKNVAVTTGRNILGNNRSSAFTLFSEVSNSDMEPPTVDDELCSPADYEVGYTDDFDEGATYGY